MEELILCLHGFLGSPKDFSFISSNESIFIPELDDFVTMPLGDIGRAFISKLDAGDSNILIGYSFGARLAMQIYLLAPNRFKKLILLAGHGGLENSLDRVSRLDIEENFIQEINDRDFESFITYWNSLALFEKDFNISPPEKDKELLASYFTNYGLSKQPYLLDKLVPHKESIVWMYGEEDTKYATYARSELAKFKVDFISDAGHRLLKNKTVQSKILQEIN